MDEIGLLGFETSKDLFFKLKRDFSKIQNEESSDNYMNFIFVANHLREWIKKDTSLSLYFKQNAEALLNSSNHNMFVNMANRGKHYKTTRPQEIDTKDEVTKGFSWSEFSWSNFGWGKREYIIEVEGKKYNLFNECKSIYDIYCSIFE